MYLCSMVYLSMMLFTQCYTQKYHTIVAVFDGYKLPHCLNLLGLHLNRVRCTIENQLAQKP